MEATVKMLGAQIAYQKTMIECLEEANEELRCRVSEKGKKCRELEKEGNRLKVMLEDGISCVEEEMKSLPWRKDDLKGIVSEVKRREATGVSILKGLMDCFRNLCADLRWRDRRVEELEAEKAAAKADGLKSQVDVLKKLGGDAEEEVMMLNSRIKELEKKNLVVIRTDLELGNSGKAESVDNSWKMAAEAFNLQICELENELKVHKSQIEYQKNMITSLEEANKEMKSEHSKNKLLLNCFKETCEDLKESNSRLEVFEEFPVVTLLLLQGTLERMKTGQSVDIDKMIGDILVSLDSEEIREKAVAFVEGLQAIEDVLRDKEEKIRKVEKELLLHGDWFVVEDQSFS